MIESTARKEKALGLVGSREKYYRQMISRNQGIISRQQQDVISRTVIAQAGIGGNGDAVISLARLGFQHFKIADFDLYSLSNFNRQIGSSIDNIDCLKTDVLKDKIQSINPWAKIEVYSDGITEDNYHDFVEGADILIEAMDVQSFFHKHKLIDIALSRRVPVLTCPAPRWGAKMFVFHPDHSPDISEILGEPLEDYEHTPLTSDTLDSWLYRFGWAEVYGSSDHKDMGVVADPEEYANSPSVSCIIPSCKLNASLLTSNVLKYLFYPDKIVYWPSYVWFDHFNNEARIVERTVKEIKEQVKAIIVERRQQAEQWFAEQACAP